MSAHVHISEDGLQAELELPADVAVPIPELQVLVAEAGIRYGLDPASLLLATEAEEDDRTIVIAQGSPARASIAAVLHPDRELDEHGNVLVAEGAYLGEIQPGASGSCGMRVDGAAVDADLVVHDNGVGDGIRIDGHRAFAARNGALRCDAEGFWEVVAIADGPRLLTSLSLQVTSDSMTATLHLGPGEYVNGAMLAEGVQRAGITYGLDKSCLEQAMQPESYPRDIVVAMGAPPVHGLDSGLDMICESTVGFAVKEDGSLDFREANRVKEIEAGQTVAIYHNCDDGTSGMTIHGRKLQSRHGRFVPVLEMLGDGVELADEITGEIRATRSGIVCRNDAGRLQVVELFVVNGDLDLKTGNIDTNYPVLVTGDVKEGFSLKSADDITVEGVIEDAEVVAGGNLMVGAGIVPGEQPITVTGDCIAPYIRERSVKARNVIATKSLRYCAIVAERVSAQELIGGDLAIVSRLTIGRYGAEDGSHICTVKVGVDPQAQQCEDEAREEKAKLEQEVEPLLKEQEDVTFRLKGIQKKIEAGMAVNKAGLPDLIARSKELTEAVQLKNEAIRISDQIAREYEGKSQQIARSAYVRIVGNGFVPVEIAIGKWGHFKAEGNVENIELRLHEGDVKLFHGGPADEVDWMMTE